MLMDKRVIKVLIVDDSALVRSVLSRGLAMDEGIEVVGTASDPYGARDKLVTLKPDVMTLDVEMPRMDGLDFLRRLMPQFPIPVIMVSALTEKGKQITLDALDAGAVDFVSKPKADVERGLSQMILELRTKVKIASTANLSHIKAIDRSGSESAITATSSLAETTDKVIAIGASTGGTEAIREILEHMPSMSPGIVIVQHMPPGFTNLFAVRMNEIANMKVKEAEHDDRVMPGQVLIAPGGSHMRVIRRGGVYRVSIDSGPHINGHCPSVEVLFESVAKYVGANAVGVMLTGMGADGADAMLSMRNAGARCLAQDEATSVVFGMPCEAYVRGGAECLVPLPNIPSKVFELLRESVK
jgi:two-component system chemotaxis response regulator CheB